VRVPSATTDSVTSPSPAQVEQWLAEANALAAAGSLEAALGAYDKLLAVRPDALDPLKTRGEILVRLGRPAEALASFERGLGHAPDDAWLLHNRGVLLGQAGRVDEALACYDRALTILPDYLPALFSRAVTLMNVGRPAEAAGAYDAVLALEPGHVPSLVNRGICLQLLGRAAEGLASVEAALVVEPGDPIALNGRGRALQDLGRAEEALASFDAAIAAAPALAEAHANRGLLLSQLGRKDDAARALERAVQLAPQQARLHHHLAGVRRFQKGDPYLVAMQQLVRQADGLPAEAQIELRFALAKALGDTGEHAGAFEQLALANRLKRATFSYDERAVLGDIARIATVFDRAFLARAQGHGDPDPAPVLIVGMPRSGSTLIEQILASHPKVFGAGEPPDLEELVRGRLAPGEGFPEAAAGWPAESLRSLGTEYVRRLRAIAPDAERIVDKTLANFRFAGLVHAALPNARIIHARRDPMDACVSCYGLLFGGHQPFAYDLGELGRYALACEQLMSHWREVLPAEVLLQVQYEDLVADPENQVRRLLDHCGLEWDPRCLEFHRTERQVNTLSLNQVREPLYQSSVGAWRRFAPWLGPLREVIDKGVTGPGGLDGASSMESDMPDLQSRAESGDVPAQLELARTLDAQGRHSEAVDWLARAGQTGDAEALTRLGLRLILGENAPFLPLDGAGLLSDAAQAGGAKAMEHLAVLIGGGFYAQQNWPAALDLLERAAEAGSASAQAQLQLLAGKTRGPESWAAIRQGVDLAAWTRAPEPKVLSASPRVMSVANIIPADVCDWIIAQSAEKLVPAELYDPATGHHAPGTETRLNRIANFNLAETNLANLMVQARMAAALGAPMPMLEPFAVLHYAPGEEYGEHYDYLDPAIPAYAAELAQRGQRVATCLIYLNDGYEGGETEFPRLGLKFKGRKGDALIFFSADASGRPDPRTVHAGRTPTSGEKWLLSQFFRNRPVVGAVERRA
jgi:tetratricopeptide (TPR) repeat protein